MTNKELNEWMATEVMGWHKDFCSNAGIEWWYDDNLPRGNQVIMECVNWHPDTDPNQAMMCADKFDIYWIDKSPQKPFYRVQVGGEGGETIISHADNLDKLPLAICEAIREVING